MFKNTSPFSEFSHRLKYITTEMIEAFTNEFTHILHYRRKLMNAEETRAKMIISNMLTDELVYLQLLPSYQAALCFISRF